MIDIARKSALEVINQIIKTDAYSNLALKSAFYRLDLQQKKFATRLVYGTLERLVTIDWIIGKYVNKRTAPTLKNILRIGIYQIYYMDSVPDRAACSTSVDLANAIGKSGASGFINGVLRNVSRGKDDLDFPKEDANTLEYLSIKYSFPTWLVGMWIKELGIEKAEELLSYQQDNDMVVRPNSLRGYTPDMLEAELTSRNIEYTKCNIIEDAYRIGATFEEIDSALFEKGLIAIQDEGSMLVSKIALSTSPKDVLDACASPGGKTSTMSHYDNNINYFATEIHKHRVELMEKEFARLGVNAKVYRHDSSSDIFEPKVDCVLVDAPCSGFGTVFRQPDIRTKKTYDDIIALSKIQYDILDNCAKSVNTGGNIVYSTCTIAKKENQDVVARFLESHPMFEVVVVDYGNAQINDSFDGYGVQLLPSVHHTAGFYISKMRLKSE